MDYNSILSGIQNQIQSQVDSALNSYQSAVSNYQNSLESLVSNYQNQAAASISAIEDQINASIAAATTDPYVSTATGYMNDIHNMVQSNNNWSAEQAMNQMEFQERMSNTAHQREIADLKAAGLNPVLSARLGGASSPSGAMGTIDTSGSSAIVQLMSKMLDVQGMSALAAYASSGGASGYSGYGSSSASGQISDVFNAPLNPTETAQFASDFGVPSWLTKATVHFINGARGTPYNKQEEKGVMYKIGAAASNTGLFNFNTGVVGTNLNLGGIHANLNNSNSKTGMTSVKPSGSSSSYNQMVNGVWNKITGKA